MPERSRRHDRATPRSTKGDLPTDTWQFSGDGRTGGDSMSAHSGDGLSAGNSLPDHSGDGRSSDRAMPAHSGDGHPKKSFGLHPGFYGYSGDGHGRSAPRANPADTEPAIWSGDSYPYYGNAPQLITGERGNTVADPSQARPTIQKPATQTPAYSGDGRGKVKLEELGMSEDVRMRVNVPTAKSVTIPSKLKTKPTPSSDTWKLICLVVIFLVWISTASTLLFLYMDHYLFP